MYIYICVYGRYIYIYIYTDIHIFLHSYVSCTPTAQITKHECHLALYFTHACPVMAALCSTASTARKILEHLYHHNTMQMALIRTKKTSEGGPLFAVINNMFCVYICLSISIYIYIHIYTYISIYIYIYMYMNTYDEAFAI